MNTSRVPLARLDLGGYTLLLGLVVVMVIGGLYATDRVLRTLSSEQRQDDALRAGLQLERILNARAAGLKLFGQSRLTASRPQMNLDEFRQLAATYTSSRAGTRRIELLDSSGELLFEERFGDRVPDSVLFGPSLLGLRPLSDKPHATVGQPSAGLPVLAESEPLDGPAGGWALAVFDFAQIATSLSPSPLDSASALTVVTPHGRVPLRAGFGQVTGTTKTSSARVALPDSATTWILEVGETDEVYGVRRALWGFGGFTVMLLGFGVIRERRQARRIRERSAELERLSSELLRANRMKSEFLASVSHELRTPLNAIVGFVELLKDGVYGALSARQVAPVDRIAVSALHLRHLVDQVLDIAKIAAGRLEIHTETVSLRTFVLNVASELESLFSERGLSFSISIPASLPRIRTDPTHLRQILVNLIGNAVKYTPTGGVVIRAKLVAAIATGGAERRKQQDELSAAPQSSDANHPWVALQIVDTGVGIPLADHERVFDEFEQVRAGAQGAPVERGTGLGLAISRRLARLLGGDITVESQVGKGSTFTVWIAAQPGDDTASTLHITPVTKLG